MMYPRLIFPLLGWVDAERAHDWTLRLLAQVSRRPLLLGLLRRRLAVDDERLEVQLFGRRFPNTLGVAAGLDKNGVAATAFGSLGFGHVEVGTVTPQPQPGNAKPRIYRLQPDEALINRMGFPGVGLESLRCNLQRLRGPRPILGINLGANKQQVERGNAVADYLTGMQQLGEVADYLTINISSPNTARLRELQGRTALDALLAEVMACRDRLPVRRPVLVKIAPDLSPAELDDIVAVVVERGVDGIIATNTTLSRPPTLRHDARDEAGGLSGRPLEQRANDVIRTIRRSTGGRLPVVGVGGVFDADDVWRKLQAGASLVQIYTGLIYGGPLIAHVINRALLHRLEREGLGHIEAIIGSGVD